MNRMNRSLCTLVMIGYSIGVAISNNITTFSYNDGTLNESWWGTGLKENYDISIKLINPEFVGSEIIGMRAIVPETEDIGEFSAWLSTELKVENKLNAPDICSKSGNPEGETLEIMFDEPYVLTEDGVYVGYSFNVYNASDYAGKYPVTVYTGTNENGFFIHSSRSYLQWKEISTTKEVIAGIQVLIRGDFENNSLKVISLAEVNVLAGEETSTTVTVANTGINPINTIGYTLKVGDAVMSNELSLPTPIEAKYGSMSNIAVELPAMEKGIYPMDIEIIEVNGEPNNEVENKAIGQYYSLSYIPVHNPVLEEFTGTWCSWCPIGFVGLELMNERHPEFIGLAYHCGDVMSMRTNIPDPGTGYPMANMDREEICSPYYGPESNDKSFGIEKMWEAYTETFTPFDIAMKADFTDESWEAVKVDVEVTSVKPLLGKEYRIEYVLIHDQLTGTGTPWNQYNSYAGDESYRGLEGMDFFIDNSYIVKDLHFNDVVILNTGNLGIEGCLPDEIEEGTTYHSTHTFTLSDAVNPANSELIQDKNYLRVAAMVVWNDGSKYGKIINANKCGLESLAGLSSEIACDEVIKTLWYDLQGRRVEKPQKGMYVKIEYLSSGRARSHKVNL